MASSSPLSINGNGSQLLFLSSRTHLPPATFLKFGFRSDQDGISTNGRIRGQALRILASANVSGKVGGRREIIMVDPLEAKQLAAQQMKVIRAKEKFERRRQIEAINGAWAMIGLTAGLVIEGRTGKSILDQVASKKVTVDDVNKGSVIGCIERMLEESPSVAPKREKLRTSIKLLKESKDIPSGVMDMIATD